MNDTHPHKQQQRTMIASQICDLWEPYYGLTTSSYHLPSYLYQSQQTQQGGASDSDGHTALIVGGIALA